MLFKNKKSEFTRVECLALGAAQWCILNPLGGRESRNIFFTQIDIKTVPLKELKRTPMALHNRGEKDCNGYDIQLSKTFREEEQLAIKVKVLFTSLEEHEDRDIYQTPMPSMEAELVILNRLYSQSCHAIVENYDRDCSFFFHCRFPIDPRKFGSNGQMMQQREKEFRDFFKQLSDCRPYGIPVRK